MFNSVRRSISLILGTSIVLTSMVSIPVNAQDGTMDYVAFGDSIAYGYGLEDSNDGYVSLVGDYLNADVSNYGTTALTSDGLIEMLDSGQYDEAIANAEVVTISIGSNDALLPFMNILYETLGLQGDISTSLQEWYDSTDIFTKIMAVQELSTVLQDNETINEACENFKENNFPTIISDIRAINPDCEIVVTNFYNPYYNVNLGGMWDLSSMCDAYTQKLNSALDTDSTEYKVANIYDAFNTDGLTNVDVQSLNLDPHPNVEGHTVIADAIKEIMETQPYTATSSVLGDVNGDGSANVLDLLLLKRHILQLDSTVDTSSLNFDVNSDQTVDGLDIVTLKKVVLGIAL